jgi:hypothetical protein
MAELIPPVAHRLIFSQNPVHAAQGTQIPAFIQQLRIDFVGGLIGKPVAVEFGQDGGFL